MSSNEMIVIVFPSRTILTKALDHLITLDDLTIVRAAIIARAANGETVVVGDRLSPNAGGITGGTLGAAMMTLGVVQLGALALPGVGPIISLGAGALVGGLVGNATGRFAANLVESGFKSSQIEALTAHLQTGHPMLVIETPANEATLPRLQQELNAYRAELVQRVQDGDPTVSAQ